MAQLVLVLSQPCSPTHTNQPTNHWTIRTLMNQSIGPVIVQINQPTIMFSILLEPTYQRYSTLLFSQTDIKIKPVCLRFFGCHKKGCPNEAPSVGQDTNPTFFCFFAKIFKMSVPLWPKRRLLPGHLTVFALKLIYFLWTVIGFLLISIDKEGSILINFLAIQPPSFPVFIYSY